MPTRIEMPSKLEAEFPWKPEPTRLEFSLKLGASRLEFPWKFGATTNKPRSTLLVLIIKAWTGK